MKYLIGIQPTSSKLHIGNYLGCILPGLEKQKEGHEVIFMVADLHALTTLNRQEIISNQNKIFNELYDLGCDEVIIQSSEPIFQIFQSLLCSTNLGSLERMPQFKDKKNSISYNMGLLTYPLLMAADIIHFDPDIVLVGEDQVAHIELLNDIVSRLELKDSEIPIRKEYMYELSPYSKIMSLMDPSKKMSKSLGDKHVLYLQDDYLDKLRAANTNELGLKNLEQIGLGIGLDRVDYAQCKTLKDTIAGQMEKLFGEL